MVDLEDSTDSLSVRAETVSLRCNDVAQVLNTAYLVVGGLCTFIGATGYYMFGTAAKDLITFNLPAVRTHTYHFTADERMTVCRLPLLHDLVILSQPAL